MTHLIKYTIIGFFIVCLFCSATTIFACACKNISTEEGIKQSTVIFSGKVIGFEYRKGISNRFMELLAKETGVSVDYESLVIKIQVNQWWKGDVKEEIFLLTDETKNADGTITSSSCDYKFLKGESYLIFAEGKENQYRRTNNCSGTQKLMQAEKALEILGKGKKPIKSNDEPSLPL